jgi:hypothetical protein
LRAGIHPQYRQANVLRKATIYQVFAQATLTEQALPNVHLDQVPMSVHLTKVNLDHAQEWQQV